MNGTDPADSGGRTLCTGVVTIASDRSLETDDAGAAMVETLENAGDEITVREHVGSDHDTVQSIVSRLIDRDDVDVVLTAGATGVDPTDVTIEAVRPLLDKELTAFGELFTSLAYERVGSRVVAARTIAGVADETTIFCLPGNAEGVRLALEEIVLPEAPGIVERVRVDESEGDGADAEDAADGGT